MADGSAGRASGLAGAEKRGGPFWKVLRGYIKAAGRAPSALIQQPLASSAVPVRASCSPRRSGNGGGGSKGGLRGLEVAGGVAALCGERGRALGG